MLSTNLDTYNVVNIKSRFLIPKALPSRGFDFDVLQAYSAVGIGGRFLELVCQNRSFRLKAL